jgi:formylglycine-generating enzyme required for sulfatase activity/serine/threonine protein kinase
MTDARDPASLAESLFAEWLSRRDAGETEPIDVLAQAHPGCAEELRRMHEDWKRIVAEANQETKRNNEQETSLSDRLRARFGSGVDPEISLDGDATRADSQERARSESKLYDDLRERGPSSGRYRLEGEIQRGGMGAILRVYDKDLRRNLAMKVMLEEKEGLLSRFLEEAQVTGQLDHPGIVPVHELGIDARGKVFFTMKLVKGKDLREVFDMTRAGVDGWNLTRAIDVLKRVCEAMAFAHEKNVVHRDLKPGNVMVGRHGEVYVMDWGLAKVAGRKETKDVRIAPESHSVVKTERREAGESTPDSPLWTMDGDAIGTPSYMPIEQAEGNLDAIGPRADVYAVGAMLYHLLAGRPPYVEPDERPHGRVILDRVKRGPPESIRSLAKDAPVELLSICEKAMARKAAQRYPSIADLGADLRAYLERRVVKAHRTGPIAETRAWIARNPVLAVGLLVAIISVETFIAWQRDQSARLARAFDQVLRLSDVKELRDVTARGKALLDDRAAVYRSYSGFDSLIASQAHWIAEAEALLEKLPDHEKTLAATEARGTRNAETGALEFGSKEQAWWHSAVAELVASLRSLADDDPDGITIRAMRDRIAHNETIFAHSIGEHRQTWEACIASIADPQQCPAYDGLKIVPQIGLLPIGRDPQSGLWEFWFVDVTGVRPERGPDGKLVLTDDFGLVFVLLPGGTFWMGAQSNDPKGQNFDPMAQTDEAPVHQRTIAAFYLSKFEVTDSQWRFMTHSDTWEYESSEPRMPVNSIPWDDAIATLSGVALDLPSEAQWERACRAGTTTPWSTGSTPETLHGYENVGDDSVADGFDMESPVGSTRPNGFGMHDMHGNVSEWCRDGTEWADGDYNHPIDSESGERIMERSRFRVCRGGGRTDRAENARSAARSKIIHFARTALITIRPRRALIAE